jgi:hypothetical protein
LPIILLKLRRSHRIGAVFGSVTSLDVAVAPAVQHRLFYGIQGPISG